MLYFEFWLQLLNQIVCDFPPEHPIISTFRPLREPLGHSPLQVALSLFFFYSIHVCKAKMLLVLG
jgi:hypothetical protein